MAATTEIRVRGYHLDGYQHVNNARFLEFLEEARWCCMEADIDFLSARQLAWVVANINISYRQPALLGQTLIIETTIDSLGNNSGVVRQVIRCRQSQAVVAEADVTFVLFDTRAQQVAPLVGELREAVEQCRQRLATAGAPVS